jgi:LPXTG-site transpeptidase (sortase) family protein
MANQPKARRDVAANLFLLAGFILIVAGAVSAVGSSPSAGEVVPANFGEDAPPLRPTVTPLPAEGQVTTAPPPLELPETPLQLSTPVPYSQLRAAETPVAPAGEVPLRIVIPAIQLDAPIEQVGWHVINGVSQWDVPDRFAAGWLKTSAPLGQPGNTVLDGHHNIAGEVFRYLVNLKPGDEVEVHSSREVFVYQVTTRQILKERDATVAQRLDNAKWIQPTEDERLTLVTCWPHATNTHRLIIVARPAAGGPPDVRQ